MDFLVFLGQTNFHFVCWVVKKVLGDCVLDFDDPQYKEAREINPYFQDRKPELYGVLAETDYCNKY